VTAGESDNRLCMLDVERKGILGSTDVGYPSGGRLTAMAFADDGRTIALARADGHVLAVDLKSAPKSSRELKINHPVKGATSIAFAVCFHFVVDGHRWGGKRKVNCISPNSPRQR
jgi:hypothetical protein